MNKTGTLMLALLSTWGLGALALAEDRLVQVTGEVVALQCYPRLGEDGRGDAHAACARHCALAGSDLGLLTQETLYVATGEAPVLEQLRGFAAKTVTVEGLEAERDGKVWLEIRSVTGR